MDLLTLALTPTLSIFFWWQVSELLILGLKFSVSMLFNILSWVWLNHKEFSIYWLWLKVKHVKLTVVAFVSAVWDMAARTAFGNVLGPHLWNLLHNSWFKITSKVQNVWKHSLHLKAALSLIYSCLHVFSGMLNCPIMWCRWQESNCTYKSDRDVRKFSKDKVH